MVQAGARRHHPGGGTASLVEAGIDDVRITRQ
jgi:hypothetical protein